MKTEKKPFKAIRHIIRKHLESRPGETVWRDQLILVCTEQNGNVPSETGVINACAGLVKLDVGIELVEPGRAWRYTQKPNIEVKESKKMFELIHETNKGVLILSDEYGETLIVRPVDI